MTSIHEGERKLAGFIVAGIFYANTIRSYRRPCTPVRSVNAPAALVVEVNGKGRAVL